MHFVKGFEKTAGLGAALKSSHGWEQAGLGALATVPAYHAAQGLRKKKKEDVVTGAAELGGLGILSRAAYLAHKGH